MATQLEDLRKRPRPSKGPEADPAGGGSNVKDNVSLEQHRERGAMAKRGVRSLFLALSLPLLLTLIAIYMFGHRRGVPDRPPHPYLPMYLPQWIVGRGRLPRDPPAIPLYLTQLGLSLSRNPIMFTVGKNWLGLMVWWLGLMVWWLRSMVGCYKTSRKVNPIVGDLMMLCLAWAGILLVINVQVVAM